MSAETAWTIHLTILAVGVAAWFVAIWFHRRSFAPPDPRDPELLRAGEVDVDASPDPVREKLVAALRGTGGVWTVLLEEVTNERVRGNISPFAGRQGIRPFEFEVRLRSGRNGTKADWRIRRQGAAGGFRKVARLFTYVLPPLAMLAAAYAIQTWAIPSDDPDTRGQAIQTIQIVHFLWPPYLFGGIHRRMVTTAATALSTAIRNTAF